MDVVYFELNNWFAGRDYPDEEPFTTWCGNDLRLYFLNEDWVKENNLCVVAENIDMSVNWCITALKSWVLEKCPKLLDQDASTTVVFTTTGLEGTTQREETYSYKEFLREPDEDGFVYGNFGTEFLEWSEENVGIHWREDED